MKTYVLDTNIIILIGRSLDFQARLDKEFDLFDPEVVKLISVVTKGEIQVSTPPHIVGIKRSNRQQRALNTVSVIPVVEELVDLYAEIDLFSRGKHPTRPLTGSARIMGKNDIWIAATAAHYNAELITTDRDFEHLNGEFLTVHYLEQEW